MRKGNDDDDDDDNKEELQLSKEILSENQAIC